MPFQNAFLGVLMPEVELLAAPRLKRGRRFDWLYDRKAGIGHVKKLGSSRGGLASLAVRDRS